VAVLCRLRTQVAEVKNALKEHRVRVRTHGARDDGRPQSSASDLLAYLRLVVAPTDDAAMLSALALPARGLPAGGLAVKYLKQAASQRGGVGGMLGAAQAAARRGYPPLQAVPAHGAPPPRPPSISHDLSPHLPRPLCSASLHRAGSS
jgi:hypothetical protein